MHSCKSVSYECSCAVTFPLCMLFVYVPLKRVLRRITTDACPPSCCETLTLGFQREVKLPCVFIGDVPLGVEFAEGDGTASYPLFTAFGGIST
jgi:hypothetical protein